MYSRPISNQTGEDSSPAQATPTLAQPTPTPQPTPTQTGEPTPTATPEPSATPSPSLEPSAPTTSPDRTPYPSAAFDPLWAIVPPDMAPSCQASSNYATPQLFCYISASSLSFWYGSYPDVDALNAAYDSWLRFYNVARETANCFDDPLPVPCEGPYQVGGYDPAGRVTVIDDSGDSWIFWTHEPALVLGTGLASNTSGMAPEDLFAYWRDNAVVLNYPSPSP